LEEERDEVGNDEHARLGGEREQGGAGDGALCEDAEGERSGRRHEDLDGKKSGEEDGEEDEEEYDAPAGPGVGSAAPLEGKEETDGGGEEEYRAEGVEFAELRPEGKAFMFLGG